MYKKLSAVLVGFISSLLLSFFVSSASAEEIRSMKLWAREQAAGPAPHTAALIIAQTLNELGLDISVNAVPWPQMADQVWYKRLDEDTWDLTMWQMVSRPERSDPDEFTYNLFHSSTAEKGYNFIGYVSPAYDELAEKQRVTMDPDARKKIVDQAQQLLADDAANAYLVHPLLNFAYDNTQFKDGSAIEQAGLGIKNIWTYLNIEPINGNNDLVAQSLDEIQAINPFFISGSTDSWITEIIWREFYKYITYHFSHVSKGKCFNPKYDHILWREDEESFIKWCEGKTGIPIIDAAMRQLNERKWMHNRLRMITAMFLSKNLLVDWRKGERYFMENLIDGDFCSNNGGWQWSASTGVDASPYFRIFNPITQSEKFDPDGKFIKNFVPELVECPSNEIHNPSKEIRSSLNYPEMIVDLKSSRLRAIDAFKSIK